MYVIREKNTIAAYSPLHEHFAPLDTENALVTVHVMSPLTVSTIDIGTVLLISHKLLLLQTS